jgi:hypothetical protein
MSSIDGKRGDRVLQADFWNANSPLGTFICTFRYQCAIGRGAVREPWVLTIGSCNMASADERFYNLPLFVHQWLPSSSPSY